MDLVAHVALFGLISHNALHKAHIGLQTRVLVLNETYWAHAQQGAENTDDEIDQYEAEDDDVPPALTAPLHKGLLISTTSCMRYL